MRYSFTIQDEQLQALQGTLLRDDCEYGALMLCGRSSTTDPWTGEREERVIVREVIEVSESAFSSRTRTSMTWSTTPIYNLAKRSASHGYAICTAHSHPTGQLSFSSADDIADRESLEIAFARCESERPHFSLVMDGRGDILVRAYEADLKPKPVSLVRIVGRRFTFLYPTDSVMRTAPELDRQVRLFGAKLTQDLGALRITIVGCGGTGSAVATLLARLGVGYVGLIDSDRVAATNLNRLHYSKRTDAILGRRKVHVVAEAIAEIGLVASVRTFVTHVDDAECRDALLSSDIIFGCTDDHLGRNVLNRIAYFYGIPVIDLGVLIEPDGRGSFDTFDGRVTVIQPGSVCQKCRKLISADRMHEESLYRTDPVRYEHYKRAGYVRGIPDANPIVVTFTTEVATMAVNELLHRLTGFRGPDGQCSERVRRFDELKDSDSIPGGQRNPDCRLCGKRSYDGRGDMTPFLDMS